MGSYDLFPRKPALCFAFFAQQECPGLIQAHGNGTSPAHCLHREKLRFDFWGSFPGAARSGEHGAGEGGSGKRQEQRSIRAFI